MSSSSVIGIVQALISLTACLHEMQLCLRFRQDGRRHFKANPRFQNGTALTLAVYPQMSQ
jgi:hypothetical protein